MTVDLSSETISRATLFAVEAHKGQVRKWSDEPYVEHPIRVSTMVSKVLPRPRAAVVIALLHDVVEDCDVTLEDIEKEFGTYVAHGVHYLTQTPAYPGMNRAARKARDRQRFAELKDQMATVVHTVKLADCIDNAPGIRINDPEFWPTKREEMRALMEVLTSGPAPFINLLTFLLQE